MKYQVQEHEITGGALDVLFWLFYFGPQEDGGLPSKSGMSELVDLGWAEKNYQQRQEGKPNFLTPAGLKAAREYYRNERHSLITQLNHLRKNAEPNILASLAYCG
jgi:hypothetical protein